MPGYKKPKMAHGKKPKMAHGKKPQFNAKLKKAAAEGKLDNNPSFKSAVENAKPKMAHGKKPKMAHGNKPKMAHGDKPKMYGKPKMYNKKPFMMEPGSKEVDSPGIFKANEPAMMFKNNMPKQTDEKSKRSGSTIKYNPDGSVKITGKARPGSKGRIYKTERLPNETGAQYRDRVQAESAEYYTRGAGRVVTERNLSAGKSKRSGKPNMYGKPKMYGKKK